MENTDTNWQPTPGWWALGPTGLIKQQAHNDPLNPLSAKMRMCHRALEATGIEELAADEMPSLVLLSYTTPPSPGGTDAEVNRKMVPIYKKLTDNRKNRYYIKQGNE